jgi:predicted alpha/beta-hydrolase family hydrolase
MRITITLILVLSNLSLIAQDSFYDYLSLGPSKVGFCDSIIFCEGETYSQYKYEGSIPLFLQIWHPIYNSNDTARLRLEDLRNRKLDSHLASVYSPLCQKMDSAFVWYNIQEDFVNNDTIDYGDYSCLDVLEEIKNFQTMSYSSKKISDSDLPVIVYHHGAQGMSDENFVLAEYFASKGFIVVASNFHLPYERETYGHSEGSEFEEIHLAKAVIKFARNLSSKNEVYFIGHSMGAQIGFSFLYEQGWANAFVSMETTLEFWGANKIEKMWPTLNILMKDHQKDYSLPILMFANTRENKPFDFFTGITNSNTTYVSAKEEFGHESYTSGYLLRYFYRRQFNQPDTNEIKRQIELYVEHLQLIEAFIKSCRDGIKINQSDYQDNFFINQFEANTKKD